VVRDAGYMMDAALPGGSAAMRWSDRHDRISCATAPACTAAAGPRGRVIADQHSDRDRSVTYLQGECKYRRADSARRFNVGRVLVLNNPPAQ